MSVLISGAVGRIVAGLRQSGGGGLVGFSHAEPYEPGTLGAKALRDVCVDDAPYNAKPDGNTNSSEAVTAAIQAAGMGGRVSFGPGNYRLGVVFNERVEVIGTKGTTLTAAPGASHVLSFGRHDEDWTYYGVAALTIDGNGRASYGIDFNDDSEQFPEFGGRWIFDRVSFRNASVGVNVQNGNIGNTYNHCQWSNCDYGIRLVGLAGKMHAGCTVINGGEMNGCLKAAVYINDPMDGLGQYDMNNVILQGNPGFGVFMDLHNKAPAAGVTLRNIWFELNATADLVNIDGVDYTPRDLFIRNARPVIVENSYLKNVELVNSTVIAKGCRIDDATGEMHLFVDESSLLLVDDLYSNGSLNDIPYVRSIASNMGESPSTSYSVRGPLRSWRTSPPGGIQRFKENFDGIGPWLFSGSANIEANRTHIDGVISGSCAELEVPAGATLIKQGGFFRPTPGSWVVWGIHFKLVSGEVAVSQFGYASTLGAIFQRKGEWVCSYGIQRIPEAGFGDVNLYLQNTSQASALIRIADVFVVEFQSMHAAYEFVNSGAAVR